MRFLATIALLATALGAQSTTNPWADLDHYDAQARAVLTGTVTNIEWSNPRVRVTLNVGDTNWVLYGYPPKMLERNGLVQADLTQGDRITIVAYKAKDGSNTAMGNLVTLKDGSTKPFGPTGN